MFIRFDTTISFEEMVILTKLKMKLEMMKERQEDGKTTDLDLE